VAASPIGSPADAPDEYAGFRTESSCAGEHLVDLAAPDLFIRIPKPTAQCVVLRRLARCAQWSSSHRGGWRLSMT
jgi:hypothetical protein